MFRKKKKFGGITVSGVPVKEEKTYGAQILVILAWSLLFVVPWLLAFFVFGLHDANSTGRYHDRSTHATVALVAAIVACISSGSSPDTKYGR